jgi:hypothetical protein
MPNYERALISVSVRWRTKIKKNPIKLATADRDRHELTTLNGGHQALLSKQGGANLPLT